MFKHILLPTDGSELSEAATDAGIKFAKSINAKVTALHVVLPFHVFTIHTAMLEDTREQYERESKLHADQLLGSIKKAAEKAGVSCDGDCVISEHPYDAIIKAAEKRGCDLIMMASHGRRGMQGLLIGSETQKVLTHTKIPVLVLR
jgi:nucleotide-binding universal stress UspA family protein